MNIFFRAILFLAIASPLQSFTQGIKNGNWKGIIHYEKVEVPFTFSFQSTSKTSAKVIIKNGEEEINITNARIEGDSLFIPMYVFDSELRAIYKDGSLEGEWHKNYKKGKGPRFSATYNQPRYESKASAIAKINNKLGITFTQPNGQTSEAIGLFKQTGNALTGSVMTAVGDFRYFEGIVFGDSFNISSFDGVHGFLMLGAYKNKTWRGVFHYQNGYSETWTSSSTNIKELEKPFSVKTVEPSVHKPYYDILTAGGEYDAIDTDELDGKVVIIQLMGTWCPNSLDQTQYLTSWYRYLGRDDIVLMAVTYEPGNKEYAQKRIDYYSNLLDIPYQMYIGGKMNKGQAALAFPNMGKVNAFPTLVMIDKQGYIRYIDSYFNGPATGDYYTQFDTEFNDRVNELLAE